jgi:hypothetical protein
MPRLINQNPACCKHKSSGPAIITVNGMDDTTAPASNHVILTVDYH